MKKISFLLIALFFIACAKEQRDLTVKANIKGLKKGTLYLKKVEDTLLVTVDSLVINGNSNIFMERSYIQFIIFGKWCI